MKAYGKTVVVVLDANDPDIREFSLARSGVLYSQCPVCGATLSEENKRCPDCNVFVVWEHSRIWRRTTDITPNKAIRLCKMHPYGTERKMLDLLGHERWEQGTLAKLNQLRARSNPVEIDSSVRGYAEKARAVGAKWTRKGVQNYFLSCLLNEDEAQSAGSTFITPSKNHDDPFKL